MAFGAGSEEQEQELVPVPMAAPLHKHRADWYHDEKQGNPERIATIQEITESEQSNHPSQMPGN